MISLTFDLKIKRWAERQKEDAGRSEKPVILLLWPKVAPITWLINPRHKHRQSDYCAIFVHPSVYLSLQTLLYSLVRDIWEKVCIISRYTRHTGMVMLNPAHWCSSVQLLPVLCLHSSYMSHSVLCWSVVNAVDNVNRQFGIIHFTEAFSLYNDIARCLSPTPRQWAMLYTRRSHACSSEVSAPQCIHLSLIISG